MRYVTPWSISDQLLEQAARDRRLERYVFDRQMAEYIQDRTNALMAEAKSKSVADELMDREDCEGHDFTCSSA